MTATNKYAFLSYAKEDSERVRRLYSRLRSRGFVIWLDEHTLLPGQDWDAAIRKAIVGSTVFLVCLSTHATTKRGYIQKELRVALEVAEQLPDGEVFVLPIRLEDCAVPERLQNLHWLDVFRRGGYEKLEQSLARHLGEPERGPTPTPKRPEFSKASDYILYEAFVESGHFLFCRVPSGYALSQGHFLIVRKDFPKGFRTLKTAIADYRRLPLAAVERILSPRSAWQHPENLVVRTRALPDPGMVALCSARGVTCINRNYLTLVNVMVPNSAIYIESAPSPIYFEHDGRIEALVMPMLMSAAEKEIALS